MMCGEHSLQRMLIVKYLYHYTSFEKAIKIIYSEQLWFSSITKTNDTTESKVRIRFVRSNSNEFLAALHNARKS